MILIESAVVAGVLLLLMGGVVLSMVGLTEITDRRGVGYGLRMLGLGFAMLTVGIAVIAYAEGQF